jgi:iron complex transport system substrate-binding protein
MSAVMGARARTFVLFAAIALASATTLTMPTTASGDAIVVRDAAGQPITIRDNSRIVSIGGAITEILYALGLEQRVVAIDSTSFYPQHALKEKPNVGYMRALSPEGVLGVNPTLILATEGAGPPEAISVLKAARIPFVLVPDRYTGESIVEKIKIVAAAAGNAERGACLVRVVSDDLKALAGVRTRIEKPRKAAFLLSFVNGRAMVAGRNTAADGIIKLAGGVNAIDAFEGYKPLNDEAVIAAKPDFILAMKRDSHPLDAQTVFAHAGFSLTPAAQQKAFVSMNGLYLLGFGPRTAAAARDLATTLYPGLSAGRLPSEQDAARLQACHG